MRLALHAEWTKLRTIAGPRWLLLGTVVATVALSVGVTVVRTCDGGGCPDDPTRLSLTGVDLGQALVVILAVLVISTEYSSGLIRTTLVAMPRRATVLVAKAVTLTGMVAAAGTVAVVGSLLVGRRILASHGFTVANGYPALSLADGPTLRATVGSVLYLVLIALLSLGVATLVRDSATSIGIVLGLLYLVPLLAQAIDNPHWQRLLQQLGPTTAGLGVTAGWAAAALVAGGLSLHLRDT